jgi:hypothetical protein
MLLSVSHCRCADILRAPDPPTHSPNCCVRLKSEDLLPVQRESSGWACEVSIEPSDNTQVRKIHFFDMGTPFNTYVRVGDQ